jgi:hypothetical protein
MKRIPALLVTLLLITASLAAQNKVIGNKPYSNINSAPGYITINELTIGAGLGQTNVDYSKSFMGFTTIHGYQINKSFVMGGGTGLSFYNGGMLLPLFLDMRYRFMIDKWTPYVFGDGGLLLNFADFNNGTRMFLNPGAGVRYAFNEKFGVNFSTGFWMQMGGSNRDTFINFKIGVVYKPR